MTDIFEGISSKGWKAGWEPGREIFLGYEGEVEKIEQKYPKRISADAPKAQGRQLCTVFYGASNFRMWKNLDKDLAQFGAQNHGFGGATDVLLMHYAERILFPYSPDIVVVQSGSNDYMGLSGSLQEKAETSLALKKHMYRYFAENLPDARFVALGALLMPGFAQATELSLLINEELRGFCEEMNLSSEKAGEKPRFVYADLSGLTRSGSDAYRTELFKSDGIHLNRDGQLELCGQYIRPALEKFF